jgi:hypothetical protein
MTLSVALIFEFATLLTVLTYLGSVAYLMRYLRRHYTETWVGLGAPSLSPIQASANPLNPLLGLIGTLLFVLSGQHRKVQDRRLTGLVWIVRASFCVAAVLTSIFVFR